MANFWDATLGAHRAIHPLDAPVAYWVVGARGSGFPGVSIDSPEGSRRKSIAITEAGIACVFKAVPLWQEATDRFLAGFGEEDWTRLRGDLSRTSRALR